MKDKKEKNGEPKQSTSGLVPVGYYAAKVVPISVDEEEVWAQFGETGTGTMQVVLHFEITDGEFRGRRLPWFGYFTDDSWTRTMDSLEIAGFEGDDVEQFAKQEVDKLVSITVDHNEYEGKTRARVAWVNKPGGGVVKVSNPLDSKGLRLLASKLKAKQDKRRKSGDDDIPF
jgi:hypothetical protein